MTASLKMKKSKILSLAIIVFVALALCVLIGPQPARADVAYLSGSLTTTQMGGIQVSSGGSLTVGFEIPAIITATLIGGSAELSGDVDAGHQHVNTLSIGGTVGVNTDQQVGVVGIEGAFDTVQAGYIDGTVGGELSAGLGIAEININPTVIDFTHGHQTEGGLAGGLQFDFPIIPTSAD